MLGKIESRRWRDGRGREGLMASPTHWMWVWASSRRWWRTGKVGLLQPMGSQESDMTEWLNHNNQFVWNGVISIHESTDQGKTLVALSGYVLNHFITWWTARRFNQSIKGDQSWVFLGRADVEAETPMFWPPDVKSWLIWKDPDAGKGWGQEEKGMIEDEMAGWCHQLDGHGFR